MDNLKLVKILFISLLLQGILILPRTLGWAMGTLESIFRVSRKTTETLITSLKQEVIKQ